MCLFFFQNDDKQHSGWDVYVYVHVYYVCMYVHTCVLLSIHTYFHKFLVVEMIYFELHFIDRRNF